MAKIAEWWNAHRPTARRLAQLYAALLYNAYLRGFIEGRIFVGSTKAVCVPGFNCYSCPAAIGACPLGALQNALNASGHTAPWYILGILCLYGVMLGRTICGWFCPLGLIQELIHRIPTPKVKKNVSAQCSAPEHSGMRARCNSRFQGIRSSVTASGSAANRSGSTVSRWFR